MMNKVQKYYDENANLRMGIYAYHCPTDGNVYYDGVKYNVGQDFRTVERYKEYKDAGFNIFFPQDRAGYSGEEWETSRAKMEMDKAQQAGIEKTILLDKRIMELSNSYPDGLIGEGKRFATEADLDTYISNCLQAYCNHPIFYGIYLMDEPKYQYLKSIGQIYHSIKRVNPNVFVQCNLYPLFFSTQGNPFYPPEGDLETMFQNYLLMFLEETGAKQIMYDHYPLAFEKGKGLYQHYIRGLQIAAGICRDKNVDFHFIMQSFSLIYNGNSGFRMPTEADMYWQVNLLLGYGVKELVYYTYWNFSGSRLTAFHPDKTAIISNAGERTYLYYVAQKLNAMIQKLAPVIMNFKYLDDAYAVHYPCKSEPMHLRHTRSGKLKNVRSIKTDKEIAFVSEMYDEKKDQYLYRIMNGMETVFEAEEDEPQTTEIVFDEKYKKADVFDGESWKTVTLENGKYTVTLRAGMGVFVAIYE